MTFTIIATVWGHTMAYIGVKGIQYVAKVSLYLNLIPLLMIMMVFFQTAAGIEKYPVTDPQSIWPSRPSSPA